MPELTDLQKRALQAVEDLADSIELRMDYVLQPGDIQLLHNHSIVHARTAYVDHDDVSGHTAPAPAVIYLCMRAVCVLLWPHSAVLATQSQHLDLVWNPYHWSSGCQLSFDCLQGCLVPCVLLEYGLELLADWHAPSAEAVLCVAGAHSKATSYAVVASPRE